MTCNTRTILTTCQTSWWQTQKNLMMTFSTMRNASLPTIDLLHLQSSSLDWELGRHLTSAKHLLGLENANINHLSKVTWRWGRCAGRWEAWLEPDNFPSSSCPPGPCCRPSTTETCPAPARQNKAGIAKKVQQQEVKRTHRTWTNADIIHLNVTFLSVCFKRSIWIWFERSHRFFILNTGKMAHHIWQQPTDSQLALAKIVRGPKRPGIRPTSVPAAVKATFTTCPSQ